LQIAEQDLKKEKRAVGKEDKEAGVPEPAKRRGEKCTTENRRRRTRPKTLLKGREEMPSIQGDSHEELPF